MAKHILLIDDDALLVKSLAYTLQQNGYVTRTAQSAEEGIALLAQTPPDLVLLDIGLPGMDGLEALKRIEKARGNLPVILLTARRRELDQVLGLELGAEDYITKPFSEDVLLARIRASLRRSERGATVPAGSELVCGDVTVDVAAHVVRLKGEPIDLAPKAFELLRVLAQNAGQVVSVEQLIEQVWSAEFAGEMQVVYVHTRWLREKLEEEPSNPKRLLTICGVGYKLVP